MVATIIFGNDYFNFTTRNPWFSRFLVSSNGPSIKEIMIGTTCSAICNWEIYTPYAGAAGILLHINNTLLQLHPSGSSKNKNNLTYIHYKHTTSYIELFQQVKRWLSDRRRSYINATDCFKKVQTTGKRAEFGLRRKWTFWNEV
jgi:hypothetical protein